MRGQEILDMLETTGAYLKNGHFSLVSGNHTDSYVHVRLALAYPELASSLGAKLADQFRDEQINVVAGFTIGGVKLAQEVAKSLSAKVVLAERSGEEIALLEGYAIGEGEKVLVVDEILTTGGSISHMLDLIKNETKGIPKGVGVVVDRSKDTPDFGVKFVKLARIDLNLWPPRSCPKCAQGIPITDLASPEEEPLNVTESLPDEQAGSVLAGLIKEAFSKWGEKRGFDEIATFDSPPHEFPGEWPNRVAVLGPYARSPMLNVARYVANLGFHAVTSKRVYLANSQKYKRLAHYDHESMNEFLRRMIFSCKYVIVLYTVEGGHFIETSWCAEAHKPTLGLAVFKPFEPEELDDCNCEYLSRTGDRKLVYCDAFRALESSERLVGGWICGGKSCPFVYADFSKMVIDLYATSRTMFLIGSDEEHHFEHPIRTFLENRGGTESKWPRLVPLRARRSYFKTEEFTKA